MFAEFVLLLHVGDGGNVVYLWLPKITKAQLEAGKTQELAEESADRSYDNMMAPPCPACGKAVLDRDWEKHKYTDHAINEMCQPSGQPDAREAMFIHVHPARLEEKIALWRSKHPGVGLTLAGDGFDRERNLHWRRYRILDAAGRAAR